MSLDWPALGVSPWCMDDHVGRKILQYLKLGRMVNTVVGGESQWYYLSAKR